MITSAEKYSNTSKSSTRYPRMNQPKSVENQPSLFRSSAKPYRYIHQIHTNEDSPEKFSEQQLLITLGRQKLIIQVQLSKTRA
ncbi:unnamed protein product [Coffea canephora]|uniref:Uncharacterized protein n=1 Tax=Coffea canephora TaxID=49390 RepID=A0A068U6Q4_COFCA|nr:unnamed protein product [Coffea canephora]